MRWRRRARPSPAARPRLGVADLDEALALRSAGIDAPILAWLHDPDADFAGAVAAGVELGISSLAQLERAASALQGGPARVHLKIDTGLSRNGVAEEDWGAAVARAAELRARGAPRRRRRVQPPRQHLP